jgi:NACalpha-BTF3-like transcription factor
MEGDCITAVTWPMLIDETDLTQIVAESCGVDIGVARLALESSGFDAETAIDMLTHATSLAPQAVAEVSRGKSQDDAVSIVCESTGCDITTATAALAAQDNDLEAAVDIICHGGLRGDPIVRSSGTSAAPPCTVETTAINQVFRFTARADVSLDLGETLCGWRYCDLHLHW